jgi:hypothetical protein
MLWRAFLLSAPDQLVDGEMSFFSSFFSWPRGLAIFRLVLMRQRRGRPMFDALGNSIR